MGFLRGTKLTMTGRVSVPQNLSSLQLLVVVIVLAVAAAIRFYRIGENSLWIDEGFSLWASRLPLREMWTVMSSDVHPPVYIAMLRGWSAVFGDTETALRSLSALAGVICAAVIFFAGRMIGGVRTGVIALGLYAISAEHVHYAQEARAYAWLSLAASVTLLGLIVLEEQFHKRIASFGAESARIDGTKPMRMASVVPYAAIAAGIGMALWLHNIAVLLAATIALFAAGWIIMVWRVDRKTAWSLISRLSITGALTLIIWLPWLHTFISQSRTVQTSFWAGPLSLGSAFEELSAVYGGAELWIAGLSTDIARMLLLVPAFALVVIGLVSLWRRGNRVLSALLACVAFLPVLMVLGISLWVRPILQARTLIWTGVPFILLMAHGMRMMPGAALRYAVLALVVMLSLKATYGHLYGHTDREPWDRVASCITDRAGPGHIVMVYPNAAAVPFEYYLRRLNAQSRITLAPIPGPYPANTGYADGVKFDFFDADYPAPVVTEHRARFLRITASGHPEAWLVMKRAHHSRLDPKRILLRVLGEMYPHVEALDFGGILVWRFAEPAAFAVKSVAGAAGPARRC
jgi:mannosyltransferase